MNMTRETQRKGIKIVQWVVVLLVLLDVGLRLYSLKPAALLPTPRVVVHVPVRLKIPEYMLQTGTIVAYNSVNLVARIEGYLQAIHFVDGAFVKKNQNLFIIEPAPYQAKLREAQSSVAAQKAIQTYDHTEYQRQQRMYKQNATSLNNVEKWFAKSEESIAEVAKAVANEDIAAINDSYTRVDAPFDGRMGRHLVDVGNLVGNGVATVLATVNQLDPIYLYFNLNELDFLKLRALAKAHGVNDQTIKQIPVQVSLQNETTYRYAGNLDFVNTGLNASTGTMEFRALLPNKDYVLLPGMFVQIRIEISPPVPRLTVPDQAVQYDQVGAYLLVVDQHNVVFLRRVTLGSVDQTHRAILSGLHANDRVIIDGFQNATPGNVVDPTLETTP